MADHTKIVRRPEDMSAEGWLELIWQEDGDIVLTIREESGQMTSVEFCNSGGRSPATLRALRSLFRAMEKDRQEGMYPETAQVTAKDVEALGRVLGAEPVPLVPENDPDFQRELGETKRLFKVERRAANLIVLHVDDVRINSGSRRKYLLHAGFERRSDGAVPVLHLTREYTEDEDGN